MAKISFKGRDVIDAKLKKTLQMTIKQVADTTYNVVTNKHGKITPVKTGYTKNQWKEKVYNKDFEVSNRVPWIERLEAGASRQAPRGIIGPTLKSVKGKIK
jgi:nicotinamide mononucleotide adenylyltransferase